MAGAILIGNGELLGLSGNDEPFAIGTMSGATIFSGLSDNTTSHTIGIKHIIPDNYTLKEEYMPDTIAPKELILVSSTEGSTKRFRITVDDSGTITATEITSA